MRSFTRRSSRAAGVRVLLFCRMSPLEVVWLTFVHLHALRISKCWLSVGFGMSA